MFFFEVCWSGEIVSISNHFIVGMVWIDSDVITYQCSVFAQNYTTESCSANVANS